MTQYIAEKREIQKLNSECTSLLFVNNCSGINFTDELEEAAKKINNIMKYFQPNDTNLVQPCNSFNIPKLSYAGLNNCKRSSWRLSLKVCGRTQAENCVILVSPTFLRSL